MIVIVYLFNVELLREGCELILGPSLPREVFSLLHGVDLTLVYPRPLLREGFQAGRADRGGQRGSYLRVS